ncbi:PqqD family protein, partial [Bacteroides xylanisolvens]
IVGRSGYFSLNLSANSVMRGCLDARRTLKSLVADLRYNIPKEEFWEDPYGFIDKLEDEDLKWLLLMEMEAMD